MATTFFEIQVKHVYQEWRYELAWELVSRQDMIRFGTYLDPFPGPVGRGSLNPHTLIYPIPLTAIDANSNLTQNPGY